MWRIRPPLAFRPTSMRLPLVRGWSTRALRSACNGPACRGTRSRPSRRQGITVISGRDTPTPFRPAREFGTFRISPGGTLMDLASPFWHWGQFYENVVRTVLDGGWTRDKSGTDGTAVNYWWGMNSGVMDVLLSRELPHDVRHLANIRAAALLRAA